MCMQKATQKRKNPQVSMFFLQDLLKECADQPKIMTVWNFRGIYLAVKDPLLVNYYRKHRRISRTFLPKIFAQNQGCGLSAGTSAMGYFPVI